MLERFSDELASTSAPDGFFIAVSIIRNASPFGRRCARLPSLPLSSGSSVGVSIGYFRPLPVTPRGNAYALLFTVRSCQSAGMHAVAAVKFKHREALDDMYVLLCEWPVSLLSENGLQFCPKLPFVVYKLRRQSVRKCRRKVDKR